MTTFTSGNINKDGKSIALDGAYTIKGHESQFVTKNHKARNI